MDTIQTRVLLQQEGQKLKSQLKKLFLDWREDISSIENEG